MGLKIRQWMAVVAAALVLAYVSTAAISGVREFALWQANLAWLGVFAAICGALLALVSSIAWLIVLASALAVMIFAGVWIYVFWLFLGGYFSFFEVVISTPFISQVLPRSMLILITSVPFGLLGVVAVRILIPERYRP